MWMYVQLSASNYVRCSVPRCSEDAIVVKWKVNSSPDRATQMVPERSKCLFQEKVLTSLSFWLPQRTNLMWTDVSSGQSWISFAAGASRSSSSEQCPSEAAFSSLSYKQSCSLSAGRKPIFCNSDLLGSKVKKSFVQDIRLSNQVCLEHSKTQPPWEWNYGKQKEKQKTNKKKQHSNKIRCTFKCRYAVINSIHTKMQIAATSGLLYIINHFLLTKPERWQTMFNSTYFFMKTCM